MPDLGVFEKMVVWIKGEHGRQTKNLSIYLLEQNYWRIKRVIKLHIGHRN
jgi:hypothetical protein